MTDGPGRLPVESEPRTLDLDRADAYGRSFADVYDRWYHDISDADATARFVARRCRGGPVLELGVGSGRLARPLAALGLSVIGLDGSAEMLDRCRRAAGPGSISLVRGDMRALPFRRSQRGSSTGVIGGALIAFNTLFNLASEAEQFSLLSEVAGLVDHRGAIIIETIDVSPLLVGPSRSIGVRDRDRNGLVVTATRLDVEARTITGQHLEISDRGVSIRPWKLRWLTTDHLDRLTASAGLRLTERHGSWTEQPDEAHPDTHISVYRRAGNRQ